jgi:5-methylcytosine-specific restriction endonuclease McrA
MLEKMTYEKTLDNLLKNRYISSKFKEKFLFLLIMEWTLLLNSTFEPLKVVTWKKAILMVMLEKVEVVEEYERVIRGVSFALRLPAVIRLNRFIKRGTPIVKFSRQNLYVRDKGKCQYCGTDFEYKELTYDHVIPRSKGGQTEWTNVVTCCMACNLKKGGRTPEEAGMSLIRKPKAPIWIPLLTISLGIEEPPDPWKDYLYLNVEMTS